MVKVLLLSIFLLSAVASFLLARWHRRVYVEAHNRYDLVDRLEGILFSICPPVTGMWLGLYFLGRWLRHLRHRVRMARW